jgi:hypothetical protein
MEKPCEHCGTTFRYKPSHEGRAKFCSKRCLGFANKVRLEAQRAAVFEVTGSRTFGKETWSKTNAKGMRLSPDSEFRAGHRPSNKLSVGDVTIRTDKAGKPRAWVKVAEPNSWRPRAIVIWESTHGPLPRGKVVHHRDRDSTNDVPENLVALTPSEHATEHRDDLIEARRGHRSDRTG